MRLSNAFTLLEMLIVVAIIGVLAAVGLPKMNGFVSELGAQNLSDGYKNAISRAKTLALTKGNPAELVISSKGAFAIHVNVDDASKYPECNGSTISSGTVNTTCTIVNSEKAGNYATVSFYPDGTQTLARSLPNALNCSTGASVVTPTPAASGDLCGVVLFSSFGNIKRSAPTSVSCIKILPNNSSAQSALYLSISNAGSTKLLTSSTAPNDSACSNFFTP